MKSTRFFAKKCVRLTQHPNVRKIYSFETEVIYINLAARPDANIILLEAPKADRRQGGGSPR